MSVHKRKTISIDVKKEIIARREAGETTVCLAREYKVNHSTISNIYSKKEQIKAVNASAGICRIWSEKKRGPLVDEMERLLHAWIGDQVKLGLPCTQDWIRLQAQDIYNQLRNKQPNPDEFRDFKGSKCWFEGFRKRMKVRSVVGKGEAASADSEAAAKFVTEFQQLVAREGYMPNQIFNVDETGLYWKKLPKRTYITKEHDKAPGTKPMKERLTLLLGGNASGDFKLKPLLINKSETPHIFSRNNVQKENLPVIWRSNKNAWMTQVLFKKWLLENFGPSVKQYLIENGLPLKVILLLDNATGHPQDVEESLRGRFDFIKIIYLPPNTTSLIQPMDQNIISNFKALYMRNLFNLFRTNCQYTTKESVQLFWKNQFNILFGVRLIDEAWRGVSERAMTAGWKNLFTDQSTQVESSASPIVDDTIVSDIISIGQSLNFEVDQQDILEFVTETHRDLTIDDLSILAGMEENRQEIFNQTSTDCFEEAIQSFSTFRANVEKCFPENDIDVMEAFDIMQENVLSKVQDNIQKRRKLTH